MTVEEFLGDEALADVLQQSCICVADNSSKEG